VDPRRLNDRVFLGVKSHGGTDAQEFLAAVDLGHQMVRRKLWGAPFANAWSALSRMIGSSSIGSLVRASTSGADDLVQKLASP
jgi:hypothetical protein